MPTLPAFAELDAVERGFVLGAALLGDLASFQHLAEPARARCAAACHALGERPREERIAAVAGLAAGGLAGLERVHPSWIEEVLGKEPTSLVLALSEGLPASVRAAAAAVLERRDDAPGDAAPASPDEIVPDLRAELQRAVLGPLDALASGRLGPKAEALEPLEPHALVAEVVRLGARTIGLALGLAPIQVRARAMTVVGARWASLVAAGAAERVDEEVRARARRLVLKVASTHEADDPEVRLREVGLLALRDLLRAEGRDSGARVAVRLPIALGRRLLAPADRAW